MAIFHSSKYHVLETLNQKNPKKFKNNYYSGAFLAAVELKSSTPSASVRKCDLTLWLVNKLWSEVPDADLCSVSSSETAVLALRDKGVSSSFLCRYSQVHGQLLSPAMSSMDSTNNLHLGMCIVLHVLFSFDFMPVSSS